MAACDTCWYGFRCAKYNSSNLSLFYTLLRKNIVIVSSTKRSSLIFPIFTETKKSKTTFKDLEPIKATEYNLLDAASQGAGSAAGLVNILRQAMELFSRRR